MTCPKDVLQLQKSPPEFQELQAKASIWKGIYPTLSGQNTDVRYSIPEIYLSPFWREVERLCNNGNHCLSLDCFLIVSGYGLELFTKRSNFDAVKENNR